MTVQVLLDAASALVERIAGRAKAEGRADDSPEAVRKRLQVYQSQTRPLVDYYSAWAATGDAAAPRYRKIDGTGSVEEITSRALAALG